MGKHQKKLFFAFSGLVIARDNLKSYTRRTNTYHQSFKDQAINQIDHAMKNIVNILRTY